MKLGVVAALHRELNPTIKALKATLPEISDPCLIWEAAPFRFTAGGIGLECAEDAAFQLAKEVQGLISAGFCGGLDDSLAPGDLILGGTPEFEASANPLGRARRAGPHRVGTIVTSDHVVNDLEEKRTLVRNSGALAVDMEAAAVGRAAKEAGLPFLCVKVVLDTPSLPLASSYAGCGGITTDILSRPWIVGRMIGDGRRATRAAERLRDFFVAFREELRDP